MDINVPQEFELQQISNSKGQLIVFENFDVFEFDVKRTYVLARSQAMTRGNHGHKKLRQIVHSLVGNQKITLSDGKNRYEFNLMERKNAVYIPAGFWRSIEQITESSLIIVYASEKYDAGDYIEDYDNFLEWVQTT